MHYRLRRAVPGDDAETLLAIYASTRADEMALTRWNAVQIDAFVRQQFEAQRQHYAQHFPQALCQLISVNDVPAGRLWLDWRHDSLHILDISLLPDARGQGLGTQCLRALMREAAAQQLALTIYVELHNPARRLYERLGFVTDGEAQGLYQHMRWRDDAEPASPLLPSTDKECSPC